jgi:hypothetical protein
MSVTEPVSAPYRFASSVSGHRKPLPANTKASPMTTPAVGDRVDPCGHYRVPTEKHTVLGTEQRKVAGGVARGGHTDPLRHARNPTHGVERTHHRFQGSGREDPLAPFAATEPDGRQDNPPIQRHGRGTHGLKVPERDRQLGRADPDPAAPPLGQRTGITLVIWVHVGEQDARRFLDTDDGRHRRPDSGAVTRPAGVDERPARAGVDQVGNRVCVVDIVTSKALPDAPMIARPRPDLSTYSGAGPGITFRLARVGGSVGDSSSEPVRQRKYEEARRRAGRRQRLSSRSAMAR